MAESRKSEYGGSEALKEKENTKNAADNLNENEKAGKCVAENTESKRTAQNEANESQLKARYKQRIKEINGLSVLTARQRQKILSNIAVNSEKDTDKTRAVDLLNKMDTVYANKGKEENAINVSIVGGENDWME